MDRWLAGLYLEGGRCGGGKRVFVLRVEIGVEVGVEVNIRDGNEERTIAGPVYMMIMGLVSKKGNTAREGWAVISRCHGKRKRCKMGR